MTWLTPALAGIAAAIAIPSLLVLYFLKLRRRDVEVSTTLLWKKSVQDFQANAPFQKLRRNILLLLQLLALILALLAIAQPVWRTQLLSAHRVVILVDRSASMAATDESLDGSSKPVSRLDKAKRVALALVDDLRPKALFGASRADEAMIIAFDSAAQVIQPFTSNQQLLRSAINAIETTDIPSDLSEAMQLAAAHAQVVVDQATDTVASTATSLYLISDGAMPRLDTVRPPAGASIDFTSIGSPDTGNVAITAMRTTRAYDDPTRASIFVGLQSTDSQPQSVDVQLSIDGLVSAMRTVELPAASAEDGPATGGVVFRLPRSERAIVAARLLQEDALATDNMAQVVLPPAKRLAVAVVTSGNLFLSAALEGLPLSRLETLSPAQFDALVSSGRADEFDVFVLDGWVPEAAPRSLKTAATKPDPKLPPGNYLILGAIPSMRGLARDPSREPEEPDPAVILDWDRQHPALGLLTLDNLVIARPLALVTSDDVAVLATSSSGPAIVEVAQGAIRAIVTGFDVAQTNWPFDVSFVVFMASSVRYLGDSPEALATPTLTPGQTLSVRLPLDAHDVRVELPGGKEVNLEPSSDGRVAFGPLVRSGLYALTWVGSPGPSDPVVSGRATRLVPVNLLDPAESQIAAHDTLELAGASVTARNAGAQTDPVRTSVDLWPYLLLGVMAMLLLEWWVYNRRVML